MGPFWIVFVIVTIVGIVKSVNKKLDVYSDDFPSPKPGDGNDSAARSKTKSDSQPSAPYTPNEKPKVQPAPAIPGNKAGANAGSDVPSKDIQSKDVPIKDVPMKNAERLFGLIGKPLGHSKSMVLFKTRFRQQHISADYANFELDSIDDLPQLVASNPKLCGFNVTIPYKEAIIPYLDGLDESAQSVGAVNAVKVSRTPESVKLIGYNTDCQGFMDSIKDELGNRKKALILGTGGAAKAVKHAFDLLGVESRFVSRNSTFDILGYYELSPSLLEEYTIIVNCTPVGMYPNVEQCPDIPYTFLSQDHLLYDVIYNPQETLFMKKGREHGATVMGGQDMFELQAAASWEIWNRN